MIRPEEQKLLRLLEANAREPISSLARKLGVARSTVQSWIERLETLGVIAGYTVRLGDPERHRRVRAHLMISVQVDRARDVERAIAAVPQVRRLHTISGTYDLIAELEAATTEAIDTLLDRIREIDGVARTHTSIVLATRVDR